MLLNYRLATAYRTASLAGEGRIATVSIHVGQDVWDTLRSWLPDGAAVGDVSTLWGYPIFLESFQPDRIEVRTTEVIA